MTLTFPDSGNLQKGGTAKMARTYPRILQIIPAPGFEAVYKDGSRYPVACWALTDEAFDDGEDAAEGTPDTCTLIQGMVIVAGSPFLDFCAKHAIEHDGSEFSHYEDDNNTYEDKPG